MTIEYAFFRGCFVPVRLPHLESVTRKVMSGLGIELKDLTGFTCCPEPVGFSLHDKLTWLTIAARNLCVAEEQNMDVLTVCNGCYYTLGHAAEELKDIDVKNRVNYALAETGHLYKGTSKVKHFINVLIDDIGLNRIKSEVTRPLTGLRVATHTGCHFSNRMGEGSGLLDEMVETLGAEAVDYDLKNLCCGWTFGSYGKPEAANSWLKNRLEAMKAVEADCVAVICPQCFQQYDMGQLVTGRKVGLQFKVPVLFYLQLLGFSMGSSLEEMQWNSHRVKDSTLEQKLMQLIKK
jgi:heterodisulfide reductase subunit B